MYRNLVNKWDKLPASTGAGFLNHQQYVYVVLLYCIVSCGLVLHRTSCIVSYCLVCAVMYGGAWYPMVM